MRRDAAAAAYLGIPLGNEKEKSTSERDALRGTGSDLSSRAVSSQVLSALESLTAVFGMGTGGTSPSLPPVGSSTRFGLSALRIWDSTLSGCTLTTAQNRIQNADLQLISSFLSCWLVACVLSLASLLLLQAFVLQARK